MKNINCKLNALLMIVSIILLLNNSNYIYKQFLIFCNWFDGTSIIHVLEVVVIMFGLIIVLFQFAKIRNKLIRKDKQ